MPHATKAESDSPIHGLNDGETIEWSKSSGIGIMILMRNGCFPILLIIVVTGALSILAQGSSAGFLLVIVIFPIVALIAIFLFLLYAFYLIVQMKQTTYYLTSERLLEVRGKSIKREIPRVNLKGLTTEQYLRSVWAQKSGGRHYYNIFVTDSVSGVVVKMNAIDDEAIYIIDRWVRKRTK